VKIWLMLALFACGGDKTPPSAGSGSSAGSAAGSAHVASIDAAGPQIPVGPDGVPKVCADWKAAIDKLATCTALPQNARDSLIAVYKDTSAGWGQLPADAKQKLVAVCEAGADAVLKGAAATCGW
jgi:hypothetical protein